MPVQTFQKYPTHPVAFVDRSVEILSRLGGVTTFGVCLIGLIYFIAQ